MAEQRLIEAEALYKKVLESHVTNIDGYGYINHNRVLEMINNEPTVEAKPVVHAHWVSKDTMEKSPYAKNHYCSNCKVDVIECGNFCTNCGAQMDEKRMTMLRKIELMYSFFGIDKEKRLCKCCCHFHRYFYRDKYYRKCEVYGETNSEASDWTGKNIACGMFNKEYSGEAMMNYVKRSCNEKMPEEPIEGQIMMGGF